ncbi:P-loop NTPase fold protein [Megasphaera elsdenii]|uniref:KAP family P-loop NTPase fold protein n=1 Tax=Megasphaera elsdenii TaxID=907 RepID=UPI001E33966C|nr:P-loop NTPase fold protein [Megasphaera elsdenii]
MKKLELKPSEENLINTLKDDVLGRNRQISIFLDLLNHIDDSCTIAVDGRWGCGKTFFVKQTKLILDAFNPASDTADTTREEVKEAFKGWVRMDGENCELQPQFTVYYDAWENDNNIDPMASLIYSISQVNESYSYFDEVNCEKIKDAACNLIKTISTLHFGASLPVDKLVKIFETSNPLEIQKKGHELCQKTKDFLDSIFTERGNRCVIFIDELDRCRPDFAVQLLERIKHYFDNKNITFVFSVNTEELMNTVNRYYGEKFDSGRYLNRFFDLKTRLSLVNVETYLKKICRVTSSSGIETSVKAVISLLHFELREINRFITICNIVKKKIDDIYKMLIYCDRVSLEIGLNYIVPLMIGLSIKNPQEYTTFTQGKNEKLLVDMIRYLNWSYLYKTLGYNSSSAGNTPDSDAGERIKQLYHALFDLENKNENISIGELRIDKIVRQEIFNVASLLSNFSDFS